MWRSRPPTLSPQAGTTSMVRAVVGTMSFSAMSVALPVSESRKGGHSQQSDGEPQKNRFLAHCARLVFIWPACLTRSFRALAGRDVRATNRCHRGNCGTTAGLEVYSTDARLAVAADVALPEFVGLI